MQRATRSDTGRRYSLELLVLLGVCCLAGSASATEVRGTVLAETGSGASGATVQVSCDGNYSDQIIIKASGRYSLGNVPDNRACEIRILRNTAVLGQSSFDSLPGVVSFNWRIRNYGERNFAVLE